MAKKKFFRTLTLALVLGIGLSGCATLNKETGKYETSIIKSWLTGPIGWIVGIIQVPWKDRDGITAWSATDKVKPSFK